MATSTLTISPFTAADRCDRCDVRASLLALLHNGGQLLFCGYHADVHRTALQRIADIREEFAPRPEYWTPSGTPPLSTIARRTKKQVIEETAVALRYEHAP